MRRSWLLIVPLSCLGMYWLGSPDSGHSENRPRFQAIAGLAVDVSRLDFGEVSERPDFRWRVPIRNQTGADIEVADFATSCKVCTSVEPSALVIPAGRSATVCLTLDLRPFSPRQLGKSRRPFVVHFAPVLSRPGRPQKVPACGSGDLELPQSSWKLQGVVQSRVTLDTVSVHFGEEAIHGQPNRARKVFATVHVPARGLEVSVANPDVASVRVGRPAGDGRRFELSITPRATLKPGPFDSGVAVYVIDPGGEHLPATVLRIAGRVRPEVHAVPERLPFGVQPVGTAVEGVVVLQAGPGVRFDVERVETDGQGLRVQSVALDGAPKARAFQITQQVTKEGDQAGAVRFLVRTPRGPSTVTVDVSCCGEAAPQRPNTKSKGRAP